MMSRDIKKKKMVFYIMNSWLARILLIGQRKSPKEALRERGWFLNVENTVALYLLLN